MWNYSGQQRPDFAIRPDEGQESVWDYPRPPALVDFANLVEIRAGEETIARSMACMRVLETASPPTNYIPPDDVNLDLLVRVRGNSWCEWKGAAHYWGMAHVRNAPAVAWGYADPTPAFESLRDWLCFYPGRSECSIDGERVIPQEGGFYGGWVTANIVGPWKGGPETSHW
jgi:uncharacterized protein (DUF427 family)